MDEKIPLLNDAALSYAEDQGPEKLRAEILNQLRSGDANDETIEFLAKLFDPESTSKFKVKISLRKEGSESQRKKTDKFIFWLTDIYRSMNNKKNFVNIAAKKLAKLEEDKKKKTSKACDKITKFDSYMKRVRRHEARVVKIAQELDDIDAEDAKLTYEKVKQAHDDICTKASDVNEAIAQARIQLGASEGYTRKIFEKIQSNRQSGSN